MSQEKVLTADEVTLLEASKAGNTSECEILLLKGVDIECHDNHGRTPLYWAARNNHAETLKLLIHNKANIYVRKIDDNQSSAIHAAAHFDSIDTLKILLEADEKAFLELQSSDDNTPLMSAAFGNSLRTATYLMERKANAKVINKNSMTPIIAAIHGTNKHNKRDLTKILNLFIEAGVDVNHQQTVHDKDTALVAACYRGNYEAAELLLEAKANVNQNAGPKNGSALNWAVFRADEKMTRLLVNYHASVNLGCDYYGVKNSPPLFNVIYAISKEPLTFFPVAIEKGTRLALAEFLINSGADIDQMCGDGMNALGIAAYLGQVEMVKLLLNCGAMTEVICKYDEYEGTPCEFAETMDHKDVVAVFKAHKLNIDSKILANAHQLQMVAETLSKRVITLEDEVISLKKKSAAQTLQIAVLTEKVSEKNKLTAPGIGSFFKQDEIKEESNEVQNVDEFYAK